MKQKCLWLILLFSIKINAQSIQINADNYQQVFEGAGISAGLYMAHHWSMTTEAGRDQAVRYIMKDCNMMYLQDYINIYPKDNTAYFERRVNYIKACKKYQPNLKISLVGNKFPKELLTEITAEGALRTCLNTNDKDIYIKVAEWYFSLFEHFKKNGIEVEILNTVNEPDYDKKYFYGIDGNTQRNVALVFEKAVGHFFTMLADAKLNKLGIKKPKIMGPSTISPEGCVNYLKYFKANYPDVWKMIDIVAYHQYINGTDNTQLNALKAEAEGKLIYQSEMHTNRGDVIGTPAITEELRGCLSLGSLFGNSIRTGANTWFYFQTNYPNDYTPAGLLSTIWQSPAPKAYKHYWAFKQLTSAQPVNSNVIETKNTGLSAIDVVAFRKKDTDTLYLHCTNVNNAVRNITINVAGLGQNYKIAYLQQRVTDATKNDENLSPELLLVPAIQTQISLPPFSVNSFKIAVKKEVLLKSLPEPIRLKWATENNKIKVVFDVESSPKSIFLMDIKGNTIEKVQFETGKIYETKSLINGLYYLQVRELNKWFSKKILIK